MRLPVILIILPTHNHCFPSCFSHDLSFVSLFHVTFAMNHKKQQQRNQLFNYSLGCGWMTQHLWPELTKRDIEPFFNGGSFHYDILSAFCGHGNGFNVLPSKILIANAEQEIWSQSFGAIFSIRIQG